MNRGQLLNLGFSYTPGLKASHFAGMPTLQADMIQNACNDVAIRTMCLKTNEKFDSEAGVGEYQLSEVVDNFAVIDKPAVWWNQGTVLAPDWKQIHMKTIKWLDETRPNWRSASSGDPLYAYQNGDILGIHPAPIATLTDGLWLYFAKGAYVMADDDDYPFYGDTEMSRLSILDETIALHFKWKALGLLGKEDNYRLCENSYKRDIIEKMGILERNLGLSSSRYTKMSGPKVGRGGFQR